MFRFQIIPLKAVNMSLSREKNESSISSDPAPVKKITIMNFQGSVTLAELVNDIEKFSQETIFCVRFL